MLSRQAVMRAQLRDAKAEGFVPHTGRTWHLAWASGTTPSISIRAGALAAGLRTKSVNTDQPHPPGSGQVQGWLEDSHQYVKPSWSDQRTGQLASRSSENHVASTFDDQSKLGMQRACGATVKGLGLPLQFSQFEVRVSLVRMMMMIKVCPFLL